MADESIPGRWYTPATPAGASCAVHASEAGLELIRDGETARLAWREVTLSTGGMDGSKLVLTAPTEGGQQSLYLDRLEGRALLSRSAPSALVREADDLEQAHGRSRRRLHTLSVAAVVAVVLAVWGGLAAIDSILGWGVDRIPVSWEVALGDASLSSVVSQDDRVTDPEVRRGIDAIVSRLTAAAPTTDYPFHVHVAGDDMTNAFALPGGQIVVYAGLIEAAESPEELAGVLAHEMQHVYQRHGLKSLARSLKWKVVLALVIGDLDSLSDVFLANATKLVSLSNDRDAEREADTLGLDLLYAADIDPNGMVKFFTTLEEEAASLPGLSYLSTHPDSGERAQGLAERIAERGATGFEPIDLDWEEFQTAVANAY